MNLSVHKRSSNGKTPVSLSVLCKVRYQQPADNIYRVLQHAFITFFNISLFHIPFHIPFRVPFHIPFHSAFQLLQFPAIKWLYHIIQCFWPIRLLNYRWSKSLTVFFSAKFLRSKNVIKFLTPVSFVMSSKLCRPQKSHSVLDYDREDWTSEVAKQWSDHEHCHDSNDVLIIACDIMHRSSLSEGLCPIKVGVSLILPASIGWALISP